ncbi:MAG: outer membrane protein nutrient binding [Chitinophagaceae bacterium]|nr:outer membrane protein nutrient binding [Chitinophagaceae bacterium]
MRKHFTLCVVLLLMAAQLFAQTRKITGKVTDEKGMPVEAASVQIKGTNSGVSADAQGNFSINAKSGDVLVFRATNFGTSEMKLGNQATVKASLVRGDGLMENVIVTTACVE